MMKTIEKTLWECAYCGETYVARKKAVACSKIEREFRERTKDLKVGDELTVSGEKVKVIVDYDYDYDYEPMHRKCGLIKCFGVESVEDYNRGHRFLLSGMDAFLSAKSKFRILKKVK